jgi:hypothetical protein
MISVSDSCMSIVRACCTSGAARRSCAVSTEIHASFPCVARVVRAPSRVIRMCCTRCFRVSFAHNAHCPRAKLNYLFIITHVS